LGGCLMSEQTKQKTDDVQAVIARVKKFKQIENALTEEKAEILSILGELYNGDLKEQLWGKAFSYTPNGSLVDESAMIAQYCLENKQAEEFYMAIQDRKAQNKIAEDNFVQAALVWHSEQKKEIPRKPRAASFKLNKGGINFAN